MSELMHDPRIQEMKQFKHHRTTNTYQHSVRVAMAAYKMARAFRLKIDERGLATGALLHDFYLYNQKDANIPAYKHGSSHPHIALENANNHFDLSPLMEEIIQCHMWPLNFKHVPKKKESILVTLADKYVAILEFCNLA